MRIFDVTRLPDIDPESLSYFAASVFWRAAAHEWSAILGHHPERLRLGPYEEQLRRYLSGVDVFPAHATIVVTVSTVSNDELIIFPYQRKRVSGETQYGFMIPGIFFHLFLGRGIRHEVRTLSIAGPTPHIISSDHEAFHHDMYKLIRDSVPKGDLARTT